MELCRLEKCSSSKHPLRICRLFQVINFSQGCVVILLGGPRGRMCQCALKALACMHFQQASVETSCDDAMSHV